MASRLPDTRPEIGQILIVIHDFSARSSDELSLSKGDRVELIERDDDFGDGWYLGRHLTHGNSGLFPEVYTRIAPKGPPSYPPTSAIHKSNPSNSNPTTQIKPEVSQPPATINNEPIHTSEPQDAIQTDAERTPPGNRKSVSEASNTSNTTSPLNTTSNPKESDGSVSSSANSISLPSIPTSLSMTSAAKSQGHGQDSPVMNETLSVIDEHITDMNSPHHSVAERRGTNDSGSEYSSHLDHRLSYINGEETDEEEEALHTREEVNKWTPDQVAEYLFTSGVESKHCEVFRDQEITGDVLLGMDQTSVFLKEFDLGSVGRRLKTWQKIKNLQDDVQGESPSRRNTATYGSEIGSEDANRNRSRSASLAASSSMSSMLPRIPSVMDRPGSLQNSRLSQQHISRSDTLRASTTTPRVVHENTRATGEKRPSAASIRDLHHSRQNSANDFSTLSLMGAVAGDGPTVQLPVPEGHKKQPSFDKNWTMGSATPPPFTSSLPSRPLSSSGLQGISRSTTDQSLKSSTPGSTFDSLDRGYFSGGEVEGKSRNVLRKRTASQSTHSRNSSYTDEQRIRSGTAHTRHSRFGSVDSIRASPPPSAAQKYYGLSVSGRRRTPSESSINAPPRPPPPPKDVPSPVVSPTVTKLEGSPYDKGISPKATVPNKGADWLLPVKPVVNRFGLRAISDAVTGHEKSKVSSPADLPLPSPVKESLESPSTRTGSSTPSGGPSFELETDSKTSLSGMISNQTSRTARKKSKKETSAYTRGLEIKTPQEQMVGADYSGWMKKKSTNLMTTWKSRLFVLKGRRLSYYYSENDTQEKGLIDISFHRVLPADNDRLTGLHATLTGATNSPTSPSNHSDTLASKAAAATPESTLHPQKGTTDTNTVFIFKLVPPRAGLSRAVNFTKPTVHYFAVPNLKAGRLWMAALMKATIDRDDATPITTTYQQKTISLAKARQMRHRPPALMNLDEGADEEGLKTPASDKNGLNIQGIIFDPDAPDLPDGAEKGDAKPESAGLAGGNGKKLDVDSEALVEPKTA